MKTNWNYKSAVENFLKIVAPKLPVRKLKGNGRSPRVRLSKLTDNNNKVPWLEGKIPLTHLSHVSIKRRGGYGSTVAFTTVEVANGIRGLEVA